MSETLPNGSPEAVDFDPFDPEQSVRHHELMAELRGRCPVARLSSGMLLVSGHEGVRQLLSDSSMSNVDAARAPGVDVPEEDRLFFFEYDPPLHVPMRRLLRDLLSRQRAEEAAPHTRTLVLELLSPMLEAGGGEFVASFTAPLVGRLMMRLSGFPEADAPQWRHWVRDMILSGFSFTNQNERGVGFAQCYPDMLRYLDDHIDARSAMISAGQAVPDDALTLVVRGELEGRPLSRTMQRMILFSLPSAGGNTMGNFVNNTLLSLARDPAVVESLRRERSLIPLAVEESLRRDSPSMFISRISRRETALGGTTIAQGEKVLLGLASANRDEAAYPDAQSFRLDRRSQPPHVAFGWGTHTCVGAHVVRHTAALLLNTFLDHVRDVRVASHTTPAPYLSPQGNGLDELWLSLTPQLPTVGG